MRPARSTKTTPSIVLNLSHLRVEFVTHCEFQLPGFFLFLFCPLDFNETLKLAWPGQFFCCTPGRFNLPIMIVASRFAVKEQQKSLKSSSVKLAARDVAPRTNWAAKKSVKKAVQERNFEDDKIFLKNTT